MKIVVNEEGGAARQAYPYLGESDGTIVYFTGREEGFCLKSGNADDVMGEFPAVWDEDQCRPLRGSVTIAND
jgi:hypothetical protein